MKKLKIIIKENRTENTKMLLLLTSVITNHNQYDITDATIIIKMINNKLIAISNGKSKNSNSHTKK